jgi:peptidylprolyl isomerase/FKBP-type peptidyl-prolyl cis-trans isomerase FklB
MMVHDRQRRLLRGLVAACALALATVASGAAADTSDYPVVLPSLKYKVLERGEANGAHPTRKDTVRVVYEAGLADGKIVDRSPAEGVTFPLGKLIPAWQVIVPMMRPGDEWQVYAPFQFAYGVTGKGEIPPSTDMVFRIKLLSFTPAEPEALPTK